MSQVVKVYVARMRTSREGPTKFEHFTTAVNARGQEMSFWMHHQPERAVYEAKEMAMFLGVPYEPLEIDGKVFELPEDLASFLEHSQYKEEAAE